MHPNNVSTSNFEKLPESKVISKIFLPSTEHIINVVADYYQINNRSIIENSSKTLKNLPRQVAIYTALKYSGKTRIEIGKYFHGISYQSLSSASRRFKIALENSFILMRDIETLKKRLSLV